MAGRQLLRWLCLVAISSVVALSAAAQASNVDRKPSADKPFAEHFLALQLSDSDPMKQRLVLSVANYILKAYGPDKVAIEVVAFGPGIDLLREITNIESRWTVWLHREFVSTSAVTRWTPSSVRPENARQSIRVRSKSRWGSDNC
jgi:hypothetical protein